MCRQVLGISRRNEARRVTVRVHKSGHERGGRLLLQHGCTQQVGQQSLLPWILTQLVTEDLHVHTVRGDQQIPTCFIIQASATSRA